MNTAGIIEFIGQDILILNGCNRWRKNYPGGSPSARKSDSAFLENLRSVMTIVFKFRKENRRFRAPLYCYARPSARAAGLSIPAFCHFCQTCLMLSKSMHNAPQDAQRCSEVQNLIFRVKRHFFYYSM